jgi:hypothetical protein
MERRLVNICGVEKRGPSEVRSGTVEIRRRILAGIALADERRITGIDVPELLRHLLLFEGVTIRSGRIIDLGHLVRLLGLDDAMAIIRASGVRILCDPATLVRAGEPRIRIGQHGVLRLERLDYGIIRAGNYSGWLDSGFREAVSIAGLTAGRAKKFENVVRGHLIAEDPRALELALENARRDLLSVSLATRASLDVALRRRCGVSIPALGSYALEIHHEEGRGYVAETDLAAVSGLPPEAVAAAVNDGLLGAVGINSVLDDIRAHEAMVGIQPDDLPVLNEKLASLAAQFDSDVQAGRLTRVVNAVHLPDVTLESDAVRVNIRRLLEVRESDECRAFRDWLWTSDTIADSEIQERFSGVRVKLGSLIRSGPGKAVRWVLGTGIGLIPGVGAVAGVAASVLDTFVAERVLPTRGALSFLGEQYQSIFEGRGHATSREDQLPGV